jgi:hypothetical protein
LYEDLKKIYRDSKKKKMKNRELILKWGKNNERISKIIKRRSATSKIRQ